MEDWMPQAAELMLWHELNQLMTRYWADVDYNAGNDAHSYYAADAVYVVGDNRFEGQEKIRAFYTWRRQRGSSTTRHLLNQVRVLRDDATHARILGVLTLYRANGPPPFDGSYPPAMIADFEARCALGEDGEWRMTSHLEHPIFVGSDHPVSISIDPRRL
jgi:hypothetical protein